MFIVFKFICKIKIHFKFSCIKKYFKLHLNINNSNATKRLLDT